MDFKKLNNGNKRISELKNKSTEITQTEEQR